MCGLTFQVDFMSEDEARWIFQQLIIAVDYCHRLGIANRDIKVCLPPPIWRKLFFSLVLNLCHMRYPIRPLLPFAKASAPKGTP